MMHGTIHAPFTEEQVTALNKFQTAGRFHPFTCPGGHVLQATTESWVCLHCEYVQDWAWAFMVEEFASAPMPWQGGVL